MIQAKIFITEQNLAESHFYEKNFLPQSWTVLQSWKRSAFAASSPETFHSILLWCHGSSRSLTTWVLMEAYSPAARCPWSRPLSLRGPSPRGSVLACRYSKTFWSGSAFFPNAVIRLIIYLYLTYFWGHLILPDMSVSINCSKSLTEHFLKFGQLINY